MSPQPDAETIVPAKLDFWSITPPNIRLLTVIQQFKL